MKKASTVKMAAVAALLTAALAMSACSNNNQSANDTHTSAPNNASQNNSASSPNAPDSGNNAPADNNSTGNAGNSGSTGDTSNTGTGNSDGNAPSAPANDADSQVTKDIQAMLELAKEGKAKGIPYAADKSMIDDVEKDWGKADKTDFAGQGMYATYAKKYAVIGFNKGSQIYDVRSNAPELRQLTLKQIEAALGKAAKVTTNGTDKIYAYEANKTFELRFIISADTGKVDHISVYAPADAVNNMAG